MRCKVKSIHLKKIKQYLLVILIFCFALNKSTAQFTKLLDFDDTTTGSYPNGDLIFDGAFLYGITNMATRSISQGSLLKIRPDGTDSQGLLGYITFNSATILNDELLI